MALAVLVRFGDETVPEIFATKEAAQAWVKVNRPTEGYTLVSPAADRWIEDDYPPIEASGGP